MSQRGSPAVPKTNLHDNTQYFFDLPGAWEVHTDTTKEKVKLPISTRPGPAKGPAHARPAGCRAPPLGCWLTETSQGIRFGFSKALQQGGREGEEPRVRSLAPSPETNPIGNLIPRSRWIPGIIFVAPYILELSKYINVH